MTDFKQTEDFLFKLRNAGSKFSLDRIVRLCTLLGNPQRDFPVIHVAGTNGKGSVCAMLERILRASGLKVGLFTSPHLVYLGERIQIDRLPIEKKELVERVAELRAVASAEFDEADLENYPSFFEMMTALAFRKFADERVGAAVIEVGLGGRLDSTNVVEPVLSVVTSIGLDHTAYLGTTISAIAAEKAGIIKSGVPVVCGDLPYDAEKVIAGRASELGVPMFRIGDFYPDEDSLPSTSLFGFYQRKNAAIASLCIRVLQNSSFPRNPRFGDFHSAVDSISDTSLSNSLSDVEWQARWQSFKMSNGATLILDSSHNEEGARTLESNLRAMMGLPSIDKLGERSNPASLLNAAEVRWRGTAAATADFVANKPVVFTGVLGEERAVPLFKIVAEYAKKIVLLVPDQPRALGFVDLRKCLGKVDVPVVESTVGDLFSNGSCVFLERGQTGVCTGSIYLAGELMAAMASLKCDNLQDNLPRT